MAKEGGRRLSAADQNLERITAEQRRNSQGQQTPHRPAAGRNQGEGKANQATKRRNAKIKAEPERQEPKSLRAQPGDLGAEDLDVQY